MTAVEPNPEERERMARAIHDGMNAQKQYDEVDIDRHSWASCPYQDQYLADADALRAAGFGDVAAERARADELQQTLVELKPDPVLVGDSWIPVADLPTVCENFMRSSAEYAREVKAAVLRADALQRRIDAALHELNGVKLKLGESITRFVDARINAAVKALTVAEPAPEPPRADRYAVERHAEKQDVSYADAWRYFEREGYDMSDVGPQYDEPAPAPPKLDPTPWLHRGGPIRASVRDICDEFAPRPEYSQRIEDYS